jgi:uncharacterized protein (DUF2147 family)
MKKTIFAFGATALFVLAASAWAADISGKWVVKSGQYVITLNFKVEGTQLTGTVENAQAGGSAAIKDGKVDGDNISFYVVRTSNEVDTKIMWKGKVEGTVIVFTRETEGGSGSYSGGGAGRGGGDEVVARRTK